MNIRAQLSDGTDRYLMSEIGETVLWTDIPENAINLTADEAYNAVNELSEIYEDLDILIDVVY